MSKFPSRPKPHGDSVVEGITVCGFKSIAVERSIVIRPLTVLAGANSSGKSSLMQAILLLKQTQEAAYDPGPLLLTGPNVKFTSFDQMQSWAPGRHQIPDLVIGVRLSGDREFQLHYRLTTPEPLELYRSVWKLEHLRFDLRANATSEELEKTIPLEGVFKDFLKNPHTLQVVRKGCFLSVDITFSRDDGTEESYTWAPWFRDDFLERIIHVPGLRGNPERSYPLTATGPYFPGTFEKYTASVIKSWTQANDDRLKQLGKDLESLGLTWKAEAVSINDTSVGIKVGRMPYARQGGAKDLVNIADVGFGVSQTLPVLVALLVAMPGQLVYIEQPELHLHPKAQAAIAPLLVRAANRGVRVVVETHSDLLLTKIQTMIATNEVDRANIALHWFSRDQNGFTEINTAELQADGSFGDWPADFDENSLRVQREYLDAAEKERAHG